MARTRCTAAPALARPAPCRGSNRAGAPARPPCPAPAGGCSAMAAENAVPSRGMNGQAPTLDPLALLPIHRQTRLADLLAVTAAIVYTAGCPVVVGSLLRDAGTGLWHLTALLDAEGDVVPPEELGVPQQPFSFTLPD